jgi:hypothetical protein
MIICWQMPKNSRRDQLKMTCAMLAHTPSTSSEDIMAIIMAILNHGTPMVATALDDRRPVVHAHPGVRLLAGERANAGDGLF